MQKLWIGSLCVLMATLAAAIAVQAHVPDSSRSACDIYARQYANATTRLYPSIWQCAYDHAHGRCMTAGPSFLTSVPSVESCGTETCERIYTLCMCHGSPATWKRRVGLGC